MGTKSFSNYADLITFSRASSATYLDSDGLLKTATTNTPRIEYDANGNRLGLLIEEQRTNLLTYSSEFDNAAWTESAATVTANTVESPDGTTTADTLSAGGTGYSSVYRNITAVSGETYTASVYAKAGTTSTLSIELRGSGTTPDAIFDLSSGTVSSGTGTIEDAGNGWYRCSITKAAVDTSENVIFGRGASGASGDTIYIYGAQLEAGSFPTSYIPTTGSTATRAADVASIPTSAFGYNASEGTLYVEAKLLIKDVSYKTVANLNTDGSNRIRIISSFDPDVIQAEITDGGVSQLAISENIVEGSEFKGVIAYKENDSCSSVNGSIETTDTACTIPAVTKLDMMTGTTGHIKSIKYYPRRLSNAQLQELTQ